MHEVLLIFYWGNWYVDIKKVKTFQELEQSYLKWVGKGVWERGHTHTQTTSCYPLTMTNNSVALLRGVMFVCMCIDTLERVEYCSKGLLN